MTPLTPREAAVVGLWELRRIVDALGETTMPIRSLFLGVAIAGGIIVQMHK